jgi:hypothetical protein
MVEGCDDETLGKCKRKVMDMQSVSKEVVDKLVDKIFRNAKSSEIDINVLIHLLVREFGSEQNYGDQDDFTPKQKDELGRVVFFNPHVLQRLEEAENATKEHEISSYEEYLKYKKEIFNEA